MTVKQLKEQLIGVPDDALIVRPVADHCYRLAKVDATTAISYSCTFLKDGMMLTEDRGEDNGPGGKQINILLIT